LHPYEPTAKFEMKTRDYNEALTVAMRDLADNWASYRRRYEQWQSQR